MLYGNLQVLYKSKWVYVCGKAAQWGRRPISPTLLHDFHTLVCPHVRLSMPSGTTASPPDHYRSDDEFEFIFEYGTETPILTYTDSVNGPCQRDYQVNITVNCLWGKL